MISKLKSEQIEEVLEIWYDENVKDNRQISEEFWKEKREIFKAGTLVNGETYVYEEEGKVLGFVSIINGTYIDSMNVRSECTSKGIFEMLFEYLKDNYSNLAITLYTMNESKIALYEKNGFENHMTKTDEETGLSEIVLIWEK